MATAAFKTRLDEAETIEQEPARMLRRPLRPAEPYPVDRLGSILAGAVKGTHDIVQAPMEICAQSALAQAALAVQGHANVVLPNGHSRPISLFLLSIAGSGDRKSAADFELGWAVDQYERQLADRADIDRADHKNRHEAWTVARSQAKGEKKSGNVASITAALNEVGSEPLAPLEPTLTFPDPTIEGVHKYLAVSQPSIGIFSDEGGLFIGGVGMSKENALKTAAGYSKLWDGSPTKRLRAGDGKTVLYNRRASFHMMLQPEAAMRWLSDPVLRDQGLFSRLLIAAPTSLAGTRFGRDAHPSAKAAVNRFSSQLLSIFAKPLPIKEGTQAELDPRDMPMSARAAAMWWEYRDSIENQQGPNGRLAPVRALANKIYEHAARLGAVIALLENIDAVELDEHALGKGIVLSQWYLEEALRMAEVGVVSDDVRLAEALLDWLHSDWTERSSGRLISTPDVYQYGPNSIRERSVAQRILAVLVEHGWLTKIEGGATVNGTRRREAYFIREV